MTCSNAFWKLPAKWDFFCPKFIYTVVKTRNVYVWIILKEAKNTYFYTFNLVSNSAEVFTRTVSLISMLPHPLLFFSHTSLLTCCSYPFENSLLSYPVIQYGYLHSLVIVSFDFFLWFSLFLVICFYNAFYFNY